MLISPYVRSYATCNVHLYFVLRIFKSNKTSEKGQQTVQSEISTYKLVNFTLNITTCKYRCRFKIELFVRIKSSLTPKKGKNVYVFTTYSIK